MTFSRFFYEKKNKSVKKPIFWHPGQKFNETLFYYFGLRKMEIKKLMINISFNINIILLLPYSKPRICDFVR